MNRLLVESVLQEHCWKFGFATNCTCGAPGIWYWDDWVAHVAPLLADADAE